MLITSSFSPASDQMVDDDNTFNYLRDEQDLCQFMTIDNEFDDVVPESSCTIEIQYVSEEAEEMQAWDSGNEYEERNSDLDIKESLKKNDDTGDNLHSDPVKNPGDAIEIDQNEQTMCRCSQLSAASSEEDLTNLTWLQNITNIMSVPSLNIPPASPKSFPKVHKSRLNKLNQTIAKCQEDFMKNLIEYQTNGDKKPPYSYCTLICMAMRYNNNKMTLSAIYSWIKDNFRYYRNADPSWQNSIRHNLSLNKVFVKVARSKQERGKGGFWKLELARLNDCHTCRREEPVIYQKRKRKPSTPKTAPKGEGVFRANTSEVTKEQIVKRSVAEEQRPDSGINDNFQDFSLDSMQSLGSFSFDTNIGANVVVEPALPPPLVPEEDLTGLLLVPVDWEDIQLEMLDSIIDSCFK